MKKKHAGKKIKGDFDFFRELDGRDVMSFNGVHCFIKRAVKEDLEIVDINGNKKIVHPEELNSVDLYDMPYL